MKGAERIQITLKPYEELKYHMDHGATYLEALNLIKVNKESTPAKKNYERPLLMGDLQ